MKHGEGICGAQCIRNQSANQWNKECSLVKHGEGICGAQCIRNQSANQWNKECGAL